MYNKFFGISLPRTGTSSLNRAMTSLVSSCRHYMDKRTFEGTIDTWRFANDFPISLWYKDLDKRFPGSGFIYPNRNVEEWLDSYEIHWSRTGHLTIQNWDEYNMEVFGTLKFDRKTFRDAFLRHQDEVFSYFHNRDDLLVLDMPYTDRAWKQLCRFVGVAKSDRSFPNINGSYASENPWCPRSEVRK